MASSRACRSETFTAGWYLTACQKCSVESYIAPNRSIPSSMRYQFDSMRAWIEGALLQQFSDVFHRACTRRNAWR